MANVWNEALTLVGPKDSFKELDAILRFETKPDGSTGLAVYIDDEFKMYGHVHELERNEWSLSLNSSMRRMPVAAYFDRISTIAPSLWMTSSSFCTLDNRYHLVAGFGPQVCFQADECIHYGDWEPLPDEDMKRIRDVWGAFQLATKGARSSFRRGAKTPLKAIRVMKEAAYAYVSAGGVLKLE